MVNTRPIAAIDIGTNSVHLVVARPIDGGPPEVLTTEKAPIRLGSGSHDMKRLDPDAVSRAVDALDRFRQIAEAHNAEIVAVATSAVREAEDRSSFLKRVRDEAQIDVGVISGVEEARLIHLGALGSVPAADRRHLVIDIGGGSTEIVVGEGTTAILARSFKVGHIRLTNRFFPGGRIESDQVRACRRFVKAFIAPVAREVRERGFDVAIGCSGTIENLALMAADRSGNPARTVDNLTLTRDALSDLADDITSRLEPDDRADIRCLDPHRVDVIVAGAILLRELCKAFDILELVVSAGALREGVVLDRMQQRESSGDALHHLSDLRRTSVLSTARRFEENIEHAQHATDLALELFDESAAIHEMDEFERNILEAAGLLHNVGRFVAHAAHHKHSYYLIRNSEHLAGFTENEIELIAQVARYHRKSDPRLKHAEFAALTDGDQHRVRVLGGILRVAIALDRTYKRAVEQVTALDDGTCLTVTAITAPDADVELELFTARERVGLLATALHRDVEFMVGTSHRGAMAHPSSPTNHD